MKLTAAIDAYIEDMRLDGRINSTATERDYRGALMAHAEDVANRDPRYTNRDDVKRTLSRWDHPNSRGKQRSIFVSFYDWLVEEGLRPHNPARQTRRTKRRASEVYRLTSEETVALLGATRGRRERRAIWLGICAGLRNAELRGLQGRHFQRPGFIEVTADIAKGKRQRWVPVIAQLDQVVDDIRRSVKTHHFVLPAQRWRNPGVNRDMADKRDYQSSSNALRALVQRVGRRAGIAAPLHPHLLRHAYADHIAKHAGVRNAQALLGHATIPASAESHRSVLVAVAHRGAPWGCHTRTA